VRWILLASALLASLPGVAAAQNCNDQTEHVLLLQSSIPEGTQVAGLLEAAGVQVTTLGAGELEAFDLTEITRIVVSSAQDDVFYEQLGGARGLIDKWLAGACCRVLQWHGHSGLDLDAGSWSSAPAGLLHEPSNVGFYGPIIASPSSPLVAGLTEPLTFPENVPFARGLVTTLAGEEEVLISEGDGAGGVLIDFEVEPSRILATTIHVESFATLQPALLNNLLAAQADEAYCEGGDDDDSGDDDDTNDDDDTADDDDDDDDDDSAEAFLRCGTRDEYGLICGDALEDDTAALGLLLITGFGLVRRREVP